MEEWTVGQSETRVSEPYSNYRNTTEMSKARMSLEKLNACIEEEVEVEYKTLHFRFLQAGGHTSAGSWVVRDIQRWVTQMVVQPS